jgi:hypothetical protein
MSNMVGARRASIPSRRVAAANLAVLLTGGLLALDTAIRPSPARAVVVCHYNTDVCVFRDNLYRLP